MPARNAGLIVVIARENFDSGHLELLNFPGRWLLRPTFLAGIKPCDVIMHKVYCLIHMPQMSGVDRNIFFSSRNSSTCMVQGHEEQMAFPSLGPLVFSPPNFKLCNNLCYSSIMFCELCLYLAGNLNYGSQLKAAFQLRVFHACVHARKSWIRFTSYLWNN
jgi:hypothetical protein